MVVIQRMPKELYRSIVFIKKGSHRYVNVQVTFILYEHTRTHTYCICSILHRYKVYQDAIAVPIRNLVTLLNASIVFLCIFYEYNLTGDM